MSMSMVEDEVPLRDLLAQTLEKNGCLAKIKAELRASTFLALEEEIQLSQQQPLQNLQVKSYLETPEGRIMFSLVQEFLEFFNLQFTLAVYEPESYLDTYGSPSRQELIKDLGLSNEPTMPLLQQLLKIAQTKNKVLDINLNLNGSDSSKRNSGPFNKTYEVNSPIVSNNKTYLQGIMEEPNISENSPLISDLNEKTALNIQNTYEDTSSIAEDCESLKSDVPYKSASSSLNKADKQSSSDIFPPLYKDFKSKSNNLKDLGKMFDNGVEYEDDFNEDKYEADESGSLSTIEQKTSVKVDLLNMVNKKDEF